ncbi:MAG TPA: hypothetical protein VFQ63_02625, partial [Patescibacteria group bacterium]|nr:hypothetical protein [Patescibacteria group bacterium]
LVRKTGDEINAVRRELAFLEEHGVLSKEKRANRVYYFLNKAYPFYNDLLILSTKTTGLGGDILKNRMKLGKLKYVMFSGKYIKHQKISPEEVDLLIVGTVVLPEIALLVRNEEARMGVEINYTVMTEEEFDFRKSRNDPFIEGVLKGSRITLIGDEEQMLS